MFDEKPLHYTIGNIACIKLGSTYIHMYSWSKMSVKSFLTPINCEIFVFGFECVAKDIEG